MQDIKMLHPDQVRLGRENKDICIRLKDDIEKAHREYDRRFKPIMDHPVDYFYRWLVEILADGDMAAVRLVWTLTSKKKSTGETKVTEEQGLDIFGRSSEGRWQIIRFMSFER